MRSLVCAIQILSYSLSINITSISHCTIPIISPDLSPPDVFTPFVMVPSPFLLMKSPLLLLKSPFLLLKSSFLLVKSPLLLVKSPFLLAKSQFLQVKSPCLWLKPHKIHLKSPHRFPHLGSVAWEAPHQPSAHVISPGKSPGKSPGACLFDGIMYYSNIYV